MSRKSEKKPLYEEERHLRDWLNHRPWPTPSAKTREAILAVALSRGDSPVPAISLGRRLVWRWMAALAAAACIVATVFSVVHMNTTPSYAYWVDEHGVIRPYDSIRFKRVVFPESKGYPLSPAIIDYEVIIDK